MLWRRRGIEAGGAGAEAELLKAPGVEFAASVEIVRGLKFLQRSDGIAIPFAVGIALVEALLRKRGLNFGDAVRRGSFLERLTARAVVRGLLLSVSGGGAG